MPWIKITKATLSDDSVSWDETAWGSGAWGGVVGNNWTKISKTIDSWTKIVKEEE